MEVNLSDIRESLDLLRAAKFSFELHTPVVPSLHPREEILAIAREVHGGRLIHHNFNPQALLNPRMRSESHYGREELEVLAREAERYVEGCRVL